MKEFKHFINGEYVASASGKTFENRSPVDNSLIGQVHEAGEAEVDAAVRAAKAALKGPWSKLTQNQRAAMLNKIADRINERFDEFLAAECLDTGKPRSMASHIDIPRGAANFKEFADSMNHPTEGFRMDTPDGKGALNVGHRTPKGVIAVVSPWNLPLLLMTFKVGPALACGNTVVVKPSEETPATATLLGEVMNECGVPPGVFNVVHGFGPDSAGAFLTSHPLVDAITFTGETRTGEIIMKAAAVGLRNVSMECGGKNPGLVFADCDLEKAVEGTMRSAFVNCGQVCLGTERVYVERSIFDQFLARMKEEVAKLKLGRPEDPDANFGPLVSLEHRDKVKSYYDLAREEGATVEIGGGIPDMGAELNDGAWIEPTIWTGLPEDARVIREEIFGPCCHIRPFDTEEEAIELANDTSYGLACAIWTENSARALRVAEQMEVGLAWVNSWFLRDLRTSFGGAKQSGIGREGGVHGLEFYTETKNICIKL
ncbi:MULTISPECIES: 2-hydroxymuconic semialdehyde dehydrogenase [Marinobacter]|jgi:aminomuconate-semialdehyde/2-hydroxymuconate-6-semialdehyde dehydrogenase|uniref:2-hydroxymuconate semialdehyde dehydrogenase n=1 Tax=Marinobacter nauticus TaxID=2743 RepID=A0A368UTW7_MARNT|nr:2-hydroxymuconic semialdehyde dehydrogenase [Marinobacter nauticus]MCC4269920.1 2-hydroxymuconic semialdehyde dehydrogenase [Marinobacter nauticus]MCG8521740.1 2-hydroxymuconic semialdehyde dehydrogenase [Pseudomonadales bacterium]RBP70922.1 2-hydroxymuconate semialdehyde dehydrogenase [Marinobacter nauticus]RCW32222.1 2-hydroxymuconate semialdehyde dehydrogenase [Marinobacter nauticus]